MNGTQKRETFIALRARKQGHQVAADIGYPHLDVPEFQREIVPADQVFKPYLRDSPSIRRYDRGLRDLAIALLGIIIASAMIAMLAFVTR